MKTFPLQLYFGSDIWSNEKKLSGKPSSYVAGMSSPVSQSNREKLVVNDTWSASWPCFTDRSITSWPSMILRVAHRHMYASCSSNRGGLWISHRTPDRAFLMCWSISTIQRYILCLYKIAQTVSGMTSKSPASGGVFRSDWTFSFTWGSNEHSYNEKQWLSL